MLSAFSLCSRRYNSVGFFQIAKLSMLPLAAMLNMYMTGDRPSRNVILSLAWITLGIAVTSVTDVQVNATGCTFSAIAVCSTVVNQVNYHPSDVLELPTNAPLTPSCCQSDW